ncbi:MAG: Ig-like domain-containing protein, partial [Ilumatobacteraceae bacterium]
MIGRVVDGDGRVQRPSELVACPIVGTTPDCAHRVVATTGPLGFAVLKLNKDVRYRLLAAVTNPDPAWACPGLPIEGDVVYLSNESFDGLPSELPQLATFTIVEPRPGDCAPITVTDDAGNPLQGAGVFINNDSGNGPTDANGIVTVKVAAGATYEIRAYLPNSGWPCP